MNEIRTGNPLDMVIHGGKVVTSGHTIQAWIGVKDGKIVALGSNESWPEAKQTINATGKYVLPGIVDPENHPCSPLDEGLRRETAVVIADGVTTAGMMSHSSRITVRDAKPLRAADVPTFAEVYPEFIKAGNQNSMVDFFLSPQMQTEEHAKEIPDLAERLGVTSFKLYLHLKSGEHVWDVWAAFMQSAGAFYYDDGMIYRAMKNIAALGPPAILCLHCENWEIARVLKEELVAQGRRDMAAWSDHSPAFCEAGHVRNYAYYAKVTGCPIYIQHTTTRETLAEIVKARAEGVKVTAQCAPHYLTVTKEKGWINTPLRSGEDFESLWEALRTGVINCIGSDYWWVRFTREEVAEQRKGTESPEFNVWTDPSPSFCGSAGFLLPVMLSEGVNKGRISLERLVEVCCENTARSFGLYPKKGAISIGSDADFVIVDLNKSKRLTPDMVHIGTGFSIFEGSELKGWPVMTILRGNVMVEWPEGAPGPKVVGQPIGQYLPRKPGHELYPLDQPQ